jgi:hypothetical protein
MTYVGNKWPSNRDDFIGRQNCEAQLFADDDRRILEIVIDSWINQLLQFGDQVTQLNIKPVSQSVSQSVSE